MEVLQLLFFLAIAGLIYWVRQDLKDNDPLSAKERRYIDDLKRHGPISPNIICPHCQERGHVHTRRVTQKKGISGGKATAAVLTGGVSMLATGLSRKEQATEAYCSHCQVTWTF